MIVCDIIIFRLIRSSRFLARLAAIFALFKQNNYLTVSGWIGSFHRGFPQDRQGNPLPWYTYAAIDFLEGRTCSKMSVFEFGSGNSTLWWSGRVGRVVTCEHDKAWYDRMASQLPENVEYMHLDLQPGGKYCQAITKYRGEFDVVVIDGQDRVNCAMKSIAALKDDGVVIWDNSDRKEYKDGYDHLLKNGFKRLDFNGLGPINAYGWRTSIFYRPDNCLGL